MYQALDYEGVFGNGTYEQRLMPLVSIDKVTIENNSVPPEKSDNPHIVDYISREDIQGVVEYRQGRTQQSRSGCYITVDLIVKDMIESSSLSSWFYDAQLLKYMHLKVVQSTSNRLSSRLRRGDLTALKNGKKTPFYDERVISLDKYYSNIDEFYSTPASGRGLVADIPYEAKFFLPEDSPQHLSYFAFCFFDIQEMIADYNLNMYGYNKKQGVVSKSIASEVVIQGGQVVSQAYIFYTPEGKLWTGAVHQHNGVWMAGERHVNAPHPILTRETVTNSKVQDFRDIDSPLEEEINLKPLESIIDRIGNKTSATQIKVPENISYFSEAFISSDLVGEKRRCSFTFSFDQQEFFKQGSEYGKLFSALFDQQRQIEVMQQSGITSLKVYRNRVDDSLSFNNINSPVKGTPFRENAFLNTRETPVLIVESSDVRGILASIKSDNGSIREIDLENSSGTRTFSVTDNSVSEKTDGLYQYSLELKVKDGSVNYLNDHFASFSKVKSAFELYNNLCSTPDYYDDKNKSFTSGLKRHYDLLDKDASKYPWVQAPARLCSLIEMLYNEISTTRVRTIYEKLYGLSNPQTGTPEGVSAVLKLMQKMEDILVSLLGDKKRVSVDVSEKSGKSSSYEKFVLTDTHSFTGIYDADVDQKYGINYLGIPNRNDYSGPFTITVEDYLSRLEKENNKYFVNGSRRMSPIGDSGVVPTPEFGDVVSYGATYLTPAVAYAGSDGFLNLISNSDISTNIERYTKFGISALAMLAGKNTPTDTSFLGSQGVAMGTTFGGLIGGLGGASNVLGEKSLFSEGDVKESTLEGSTSSTGLLGMASFFSIDDAMENQLTIACFDLAGDECAVFDKYIQPPDELQIERVKQIPNQIKSLFFSNNADVSKNNWFEQNYDVAKSYKTSLMFMLNYQVISKVEYLSGYQRATTEGSQVSYPVWKPLTYGVMAALRTSRKTILCKMTNYYDDIYGVGQSKFSGMPIYNQYFHIASDEAVATRVSRRRARRRRGVQSVYDALLQSGVDISRKYAYVPRSALKTILNQARSRNSSGDVTEPNKNLPDQNEMENIFDLLLDEAQGVCTIALPPDRQPEQAQRETVQEQEQDETPADTPVLVLAPAEFTLNTKQDDTYEESKNEDFLETTPTDDYDYDSMFGAVLGGVVADTVEKYESQPTGMQTNGSKPPSSGAETEQVKDFIPEYVEKVYGKASESSPRVQEGTPSEMATPSAQPTMSYASPERASTPRAPTRTTGTGGGTPGGGGY